MSHASVSCVEELPDAARYAPYARGRYDVRAGLAALGTDFGNGAADGQVFQIDAGFQGFRQNKLEARAERLGKYWRAAPTFDAIAAPVCTAIARRLAAEHREVFRLDETPESPATPRETARHGREHGGALGDAISGSARPTGREHAEHAAQLGCELTGETLRFDTEWRLMEATPSPAPSPPYADAFDALACQVAEDLAVIRRLPDGGDEVCAIHLCAANHWSAEDKVGGSFAHVHAPVPGMEPVNRRATNMVDAMIDRGPFVRFVWGVATDARLNHHPDPPPGITDDDWHGRRFDPAHPRLWVRIERQVIYGIPEAEAALFTIRTSFRDGEALRADPQMNAALQAGLRSMTPEQAVYKGVHDSRDGILSWLQSTTPTPPEPL